MEIIDQFGHPIKIENLELAIRKVDEFRRPEHQDPAFTELDRKLQAYWEDVYQNLIKLRGANSWKRPPQHFPSSLGEKLLRG